MSDPLIVEIEKKEIEVSFENKNEIQIDFPQSITINTTINEAEPSDINIQEYEAGSAININRVVVLMDDGRIEHADKDNPLHALDVIGISKTSGATGQMVEVIEFGTLNGVSFGDVADNFFLGNNGQVSSSSPTTGIWLNVGIQITPNSFFVKIGESILL